MLNKLKELPKKTKIIISIILGVLALALIGSFLPDIEADEVTTTEAPELTFEQQMRVDLEDLLGEYTNRKDDDDNKIKKVHEVELQDDLLIIRLGADDNLFGTTYILNGMHNNIIDVMEEVDFDVEKVKFEFYFGLTDDDFNTVETKIFTCFILKAKYNINWDNVNYDDIPGLVDSYWKHPGL